MGHVTCSKEDPEVTFVKVWNSLERKMPVVRQDVESEEEPEDDCDCAAGYLCLQRDVELLVDDDQICGVCKRQAHNICLLATDDVRMACLKCFGDDEI